MSVACTVFAVAVLCAQLSAAVDVNVDWGKIVGTSKTTTTLQVVSNPILDRTFTYNGKTFANPIHDRAWASLANLEAYHVRYVPWFPYPKKSVAELIAPNSTATSWSFDDIIPQLYDFMASTYGKGRTTVINFSTQPCWLFKQKPGVTCSFPENPNESDFGYVKGTRADIVDPSSHQLAGYYARLMSWLTVGSFKDENGKLITGGPQYNLSGHIWELFNEAEHSYTVEEYIHDYAVVVPAMIAAAGDSAPGFMGIGGASPAWIAPFLNASRAWRTSGPPVDFISQHFYAGCSNRSDPNTFTGFFSGADNYMTNVVSYMATIASLRPDVKLDLDELGVIMPDDNDPKWKNNYTGLPSLYWNAAGAMYAHLFAGLVPHGVAVLGHSQLAGSPALPEWGIPLPQYPSVSLLHWTTGYGNARYWALMLLLQHFAPGDTIVSSTVSSAVKNANPFCGTSPGLLSMSCASPNSVLTVMGARWGTSSVTAYCNFTTASCNAPPAHVLQWAAQQCNGKNSCSLVPYPALGDPCYGTVKTFSVVAKCSGEDGGSVASLPTVSAIAMVSDGGAGKRTRSVDTFALDINGHPDASLVSAGTRKVLLINKLPEPQTVTLNVDTTGAYLHYVDSRSVSIGAAYGIRTEVHAGGPVPLGPFAIVVVTFRDAAAH